MGVDRPVSVIQRLKMENMAQAPPEHGGGVILAACTLQVSRSVPGGEHDHLDDQVHAQAPMAPLSPVGNWGRTQYLQGAQDDDGDGAQEDPGAVGLGREHLADEGLGVGVDGGANPGSPGAW